MKVLILISEIKYSGAAKILSWLANSFCSQGYNVSFLTFIDGEDRQYLDNKVKRVVICEGTSNKYIRTIKAIRKTHKILKIEGFDIIISFLPLEGMISVLSALFTKTKVIVSERSDPYHEKSLIANISRFMFRFADGAVFQSEGAKKHYPQILQRKSVIIPNPIPNSFSDIIPYQKRSNVIVSSSRLEIKQKRQDVLIKAFKKILETLPDVRLKLIGDGPDEIELKKLAASLGILDSVLFVGRSKNVIQDICDARIYAFSSDFEGMPNSVLEALSVGLPVVTTDYSPGGARELIEKVGRGYVVPTGDYLGLAEKIISILNNENDGIRMSENALSVCAELSEERIFKKWVDYLETIVK